MIYDLSPPISPSLAVWPGDTPPTREVLREIARGSNITLSTLRTTVHLGSHADAPSHYGLDAPTIDRRDLSIYIGACRVIHVAAGRGARIGRSDLMGPIDAPRILLRTGTFPDPSTVNDDFAALDPSLIDDLHREGVILVGLDTPSVDLFDSKELPAHHAFLRNDMAILEGLRLDGVPEGLYELIALPLRLVDFDASPVRAILRDLPR